MRKAICFTRSLPGRNARASRDCNVMGARRLCCVSLQMPPSKRRFSGPRVLPMLHLDRDNGGVPKQRGHPVAVARAGPAPGIPAGIRAVFPRQVVTEKRGRSSCRGIPIRMPRKWREFFLKKLSATPIYRTTFGVKGRPFCRFHIESSEVRPTWCRISSTGHSIVFRGVPLF